MRQLLEQRGLARLAQVGRREQEVIAVVVLLPERFPLGLHDAQCRGDQQDRKPVHFRAVSPLAHPVRVLVGRMADLARFVFRQRRHPHAVVVDQLQRQRIGAGARHEEDVAVLEVAVGHVRRAQVLRHPPPDL